MLAKVETATVMNFAPTQDQAHLNTFLFYILIKRNF